ncbi:hypothetical protein DPMN_183093 [Dreissena polymorpha]|uniref:Uncharacterized protein n=1 Tax=Dreissena polymorpha TaxID=45954 RepID=A0A9D4I3B0_DREPO|nr:hypothetical protein DPMN_183093 [Dreissena polymorpha]
MYVSPVGQLLICGGWPKYYIIQLDYEGKKKLTFLAAWKEGLGGQSATTCIPPH